MPFSIVISAAWSLWSILFRIKVNDLSVGKAERIFVSCSVMPSWSSINSRIWSACANSFCVLRIPSSSTISLVASCRPAVSEIRSGKPPRWICSRNTSRVVPATSVTIAASCPASRLCRLDLPALGWPARTTLMPSRNKRPCRALPWMPASVASSCCSCLSTWASPRKSISSSTKSMEASTNILK